MKSRTQKILGWTLTGALSIIFIMSAYMKLFPNNDILTQAASIGLDAHSYFCIGVIEITSLILFIIPRTGIIGTLLLVAYMGGAIVTHLEHDQPILTAVIIQSLVWITAFIRFPEMKQRLLSI
jgi:uncharacterized membrane protein YphA (DoxX/SURF4 family)